MSGFKWVAWLPYWILDSGCPKSKVDPQSTLLYAGCRAAGVPAAPIFQQARSGAGRFTRESSHDVSNNIRGEKSIFAIFPKDFFVSWQTVQSQEVGT